LISVLTVISAYVLLLLLLLFSPTKARVFLEYSLAATQPNLLYMGYPILHILFGESFLYITAVSSLVHSLLVHPLNVILAHHLTEPEREAVIVLNDITDPASPDPEPETEQRVSDQIEEPLVPDEIVKADPPPEKDPLWKVVLFAFLTPANIGFVLGILWSLTPWDMFTFLSVFVVDLERSVVASGLFCAGTYAWEHPFLHGDAFKIAVSVISHAVVLPGIAALWCWLLGVSNRVATGLVLVHATSMSFRSLMDAEKFGLREKAPTHAFVWSSLLSTPVLMAWVVVLNQGHLFGN
jgi:predicted permease